MFSKIAALAGAGLFALSASTPAMAAPAPARPSFTGLWQVETFIETVKTTAGSIPPLRPEARKLYESRIAARAAGKAGDPIDDCLPHGVPRVMYAPYPLLIVQSNGQVDMVQEANHTQRLIYVDDHPPPEEDPRWMGQSLGRWEGQALVVETTSSNDQTWLDKAGLPHSSEMRVVERLQLQDGGQTLVDTITIDDPKTYTAPWTTALRLKRKAGPLTLAERACFVDHRM